MRKLLLAAVLTITSMTAFTASASAAPIYQPTSLTEVLNLKPLNQQLMLSVDTKTPEQKVVIDKPAEPEAKPAPQPVIYVVVAGDNLTKIGEAHSVAWLRIWQKNTGIANPDVIHVGDQLTIPLDAEQLPERPLPATAVIPAPTNAAAATQPRGAVAGNTYDYGYCTWYVKNRRADLPNNLGNANTWYSRAAAQGYAVGSTPRAGAVGTTTRGSLGHVVYVESVNPDGSINISEMNAPTWGAVTHRVAAAGEFSYIY